MTGAAVWWVAFASVVAVLVLLVVMIAVNVWEEVVGTWKVARDDLAVWRCCSAANRKTFDLCVQITTPTVTHVLYSCVKPSCKHAAAVEAAKLVAMTYAPRSEPFPSPTLFDG